MATEGDSKPQQTAQPETLVLPRKGGIQLRGEDERATLREETRSWIAKKLVCLLAIVFVALVGLVGANQIDVNDAVSILAPLTAVVGTALGFYFGGHTTG